MVGQAADANCRPLPYINERRRRSNCSKCPTARTITHLRCERHLLVARCHLDSRSRGLVSHSGISKAEGEDIILQISWTCLNHWRRCPGPECRNLQDSSQSLAGSCARLWFVVPDLTGDQSRADRPTTSTLRKFLTCELS